MNVLLGVLPLVESVNTEFAPPLPGVALDGEKLQVVEFGSPEQESVTAALNVPPTGFRPILKLTDCPCFTVAAVGFAETEKSAPVPLRPAVWGLPLALSVMFRVAD